ncbi:MAG: HAD family phosphatase [Promethearchaeota archaeon]|nr:MAG: HAD family phosphatase [Candidatus Lokiarchaeota archaeon]
MSFEEKYQKDKEHYNKKIFKSQKVKLHKIKYWLFDFAGVLAEGPKVLSKVITIINNDFGLNISKKDSFVSKERRKLSSGRITSRDFLEKLFKEYYNNQKKDYNKGKFQKVDIDHYLDLWFNMYSELTQVSSDMEEIILRLRKAGYTVCLISNTYDIHAKSNKLKGFFDLFDQVFLSSELRMRKPEIEQYKYVLDKIKAEPNECIFIDDKLMNLVPARKLGMTVIRFESFDKFKYYLNALNIDEITPDLRVEIKNKYETYEISKKDYKAAKKSFKKSKKEFKKLKKKKSSKKKKYRKAKKRFKAKQKQIEKLKRKYKTHKKIKEKELEPKLKLEQKEKQKKK